MSYPGVWKITTAPAAEPVSLDEAKLQLRITDDVENELVERLIGFCRRRAEDIADRSLITQKISYRLDAWPSGDLILLPRSPVSAIDSIKYIDTAGVEQTLAAAVYSLDSYSIPARLQPAYDQEWPDLREVPNAVTVAYTAGFGAAAANVPLEFVQAILLMMGDYYEFRESIIVGTIVAEAEKVAGERLAAAMRADWSF